MEIRLVMKTARSVSLELDDGGIYKTKEVYRILVNGDEVKTTDTVITSLYGLKPDTDYEIGVEDAHGTRQGEIAFRTDYEFVTLNVRKFGAKGDGVSDDTTFIQAAIMACPPESRVLIPAGTVHCSGKNTMVLEISATPYIFTFKLWDWGRLGMDGLPRPIHLDHGMKNIQWNRDTKWVYDNIVGQTSTLEKTENCEVERTGLHSREFIDTIRYTLSGPHTISMDDTVHVMNLVEGRSARIESMDGSFAPFTVHYAETAIVPAAVGTYRIVPEEGEMIKMLVASVG